MRDWDYARFLDRLGGGPAAAGDEPDASTRYYRSKALLHQQLLRRLDLRAAESMPPDELRRQLAEMVATLIDEERMPLSGSEREQLTLEMYDEIVGLGPLEPLLADPGISEIMVNGFDTVFIERQGRLQRIPSRFNDNAHLLRVIGRIVASVGRRIDESSPMADARLADGSRVNAIIPPVALDGPLLSIRRFSSQPLGIRDLVAGGALTASMARFLEALVRARVSVAVSGGTGSGKTTLLNILSGFIPDGERIVSIEDTAELQLQQVHVLRLETRPPNAEGRGEVTCRSLLRNALRMRPDRIIVGEVRAAEVFDMLQAMNTGHDGSLTTIHANNPGDALRRLENLASTASPNLTLRALREQIASAIEVVIQVERLSDGSRKVVAIDEIAGMVDESIATRRIFEFQRQGMDDRGRVCGEFRWCGTLPAVLERMRVRGVECPDELFAGHPPQP